MKSRTEGDFIFFFIKISVVVTTTSMSGHGKYF